LKRNLLDNQTIKQKLIDILAFTAASAIASNYAVSQYNKMMNNILKKNDFSMLGPMHTILAGLKALICD
jgi:hypothetical protein